MEEQSQPIGQVCDPVGSFEQEIKLEECMDTTYTPTKNKDDEPTAEEWADYGRVMLEGMVRDIVRLPASYASAHERLFLFVAAEADHEGWATLDQLVARTGLDREVVIACWLALQKKGLLTEGPDGRADLAPWRLWAASQPPRPEPPGGLPVSAAALAPPGTDATRRRPSRRQQEQ